MGGILFYLVILAIFLGFRAKKKSGSGKDSRGGRRSLDRGRSSAGSLRDSLRGSNLARALDGHILRGDKDITCRQYGHRHEEDAAPRFIVHDDPEDGFIILNGVKMRISEADHYENTI